MDLSLEERPPMTRTSRLLAVLRAAGAAVSLPPLPRALRIGLPEPTLVPIRIRRDDARRLPPPRWH
jgi:hypothetical protein